MKQHHPLLLFVILLTFSLQLHAREGHFFFSKTSPSQAASDASSATDSYGVRSYDFPSASTATGNYYNTDNPEFSAAENYDNKERRDVYVDNIPSVATTASYNYNTNPNTAEFSTPDVSLGAQRDFFPSESRYDANEIPTTFSGAEFNGGSRSYQDKERRDVYVDNIPSTATTASYNYNTNPNTAEFATDNRESFGTRSEFFPSESRYENKGAEFARGSSRSYDKVPSYEANYGKEQQGMSDTRFLENGKYFYDVNAERNSKGYENQLEGREEVFVP